MRGSVAGKGPGAWIRELEERDQRFQLARVVQVTERMLLHAHADEWSEVAALEAQRAQGMAACYGMQDDTVSAEMADALATLLDLNEQLVEVVQHARQQLDDERRFQQRSVTAVLAYSGSAA